MTLRSHHAARVHNEPRDGLTEAVRTEHRVWTNAFWRCASVAPRSRLSIWTRRCLPNSWTRGLCPRDRSIDGRELVQGLFVRDAHFSGRASTLKRCFRSDWQRNQGLCDVGIGVWQGSPEARQPRFPANRARSRSASAGVDRHRSPAQRSL